MDGATAGFSQIAQSLEGLSTLMSGMGYLLGLGCAIRAVLSFKQHGENPGETPLAVPLTMAIFAGMLLMLPNLLKTTLSHGLAQVGEVGAPADIRAANNDRAQAATDKSAPQAAIEQASLEKAAEKKVENTVAQVASPEPATTPAPVVIEKLATPEEARASADRKAILEVLLGVGIALAAGLAAWVAGKRRRGAAAPKDALPEVQFLDGASKGGFDRGDIFGRTAAFEKAADSAKVPKP